MAGRDPVDAALKAIADPRRREILRLVAHDELAAGEIAAAFDVARPTVSEHLGVLKSAGLLSERRAGTRRLYRASPDGIEAVRAYLEDLWDAALDTARRLVEVERGLSDDDAEHRSA